MLIQIENAETSAGSLVEISINYRLSHDDKFSQFLVLQYLLDPFLNFDRWKGKKRNNFIEIVKNFYLRELLSS